MKPRYARTSRWYAPLAASMAVFLLVANIGATKGVVLGPIITDGGFFIFPFSYIVGDIITELYGFRKAVRALVTGFVLSVISALSFWVIIWLPGFESAQDHQDALAMALTPVPLIVAASLLGFLVGQITNSWIMVRLKARFAERRLWLRLMTSSGVGEWLDTLIFCSIAAQVIGITSFTDFLSYTFWGFLYKAAVEYAFVPLTAWAIAWFKKHEPGYFSQR